LAMPTLAMADEPSEPTIISDTICTIVCSKLRISAGTARNSTLARMSMLVRSGSLRPPLDAGAPGGAAAGGDGGSAVDATGAAGRNSRATSPSPAGRAGAGLSSGTGNRPFSQIPDWIGGVKKLQLCSVYFGNQNACTLSLIAETAGDVQGMYYCGPGKRKPEGQTRLDLGHSAGKAKGACMPRAA
jgi:hypothetical protein